MKHLKIKILESLILITIIASLIVIFFFAKDTLNKKPQLSETNHIQNYSTTKIHEYPGIITDSYIYAIPYQELIYLDLSSFTKYITSTDNIINTYTEKIKLKYNETLLPEQETFIKNYCNTYDLIEIEYKFQCSYSDRTISISNTFYIDKINTETIKNNHNIEIILPIKKGTRLNEYTTILNQNLIVPQEVDKIK